MKSKIEIIKGLYNSGKITFEEALILASKEQTDKDVKELKDVTVTRAMTREEVKEMLYYEAIDEFDPTNIVEYMNKLGWTWGEGEINKTDILNHIKKLLNDMVDLMYSYVDEHKIQPDAYSAIEKQFSICSGGFNVTGFFDCGTGMPTIEIEFIAESLSATINSEDFSKAI